MVYNSSSQSLTRHSVIIETSVVSLGGLYESLSFLGAVLDSAHCIFGADFSDLINGFASMKSSGWAYVPAAAICTYSKNLMQPVLELSTLPLKTTVVVSNCH